MFELTDRFETTDGSRPETAGLDEAAARAHRLVAFTLLEGGDVFDPGGSKPVTSGLDEATRYVREKLVIEPHGHEAALAERVSSDVVRQLVANPALARRMLAAKPVVVDLVDSAATMVKLGYPRSVARHASGLFWDHKSWDTARIALRADRLGLDEEKALVFHEFGHALHYLAFTTKERELIYKVLRPSFGSRAAMDEVFAIYTEREFLGPAGFGALEKKAPGVYGFTRRQWDEGHLFTAFVRKLYFPARPVAGPKGKAAGDAWRKFSGG